ncbi:MAG: hypothetical protein Ct9H90mP20_3950 [Candidatus Neomarinimicrobiota bacterium]|nr:MAG: hypothetical protein Ct9H90mP20_3950 [Candidatus Neomarinimicrobiota bacterium]
MSTILGRERASLGKTQYLKFIGILECHQLLGELMKSCSRSFEENGFTMSSSFKAFVGLRGR